MGSGLGVGVAGEAGWLPPPQPASSNPAITETATETAAGASDTMHDMMTARERDGPQGEGVQQDSSPPLSLGDLVRRSHRHAVSMHKLSQLW
jgi:hypothetical protein